MNELVEPKRLERQLRMALQRSPPVGLPQDLADAGFRRQHELRRKFEFAVGTIFLPGDLAPQRQDRLALAAKFTSSKHLHRPGDHRHVALELRVLAQKALQLAGEERELEFVCKFL